MDNASGGSVIWNFDVDLSKLEKGLVEARSKVKKTATAVDKTVSKTNKNTASFLSNIGSGFVKLGSGLQTLGSNVVKAGDKLSNFGSSINSAVAPAALVLAGGLGFVSKMAFDQVNSVEQATLALRAYEKDGKKVDNVLSGLLKYARSDMGVLFNRKDLFAAAQGLKIMGDDTEDLTDHVKIMSRSVGLGLSTWDDLTRIIGRVGSTGKLTGIDFDNLTKSGFVLDDSLRNTDITFQELFKHLDKGIPVSAMKGQASSIKGIGVRLQTAFRGIGESILQVDKDTGKFIKGGAGDRLVRFFEKLPKTLSDPEIQESLKKIGDSLAKFAEDALPKIENFIKFLGRNIGTISKVTFGLLAFGVAAKIIGTILKPIGLIIQGLGLAIKGTGKALGLLGKVFNKTTAKSFVSAVKMAGHAIMVGAKWTINAAKVSAQWAFHTGKMVARSSWAVIKMIPHAADVGLAWVINATRVAFVWTTQTLPKLIIGFVRTSIQASIHAIKTSTAWVLSATKSGTAWTITRLPRIIAGFARTSVQAVIHAAKSSGAWVVAASKSATAWLVTQLPRIIKAFILSSASAVKHAAIAKAAWVGAAIKSTASFKAMSALIATPMVMPAIVVAAAIASLWTVWKAIQSVRSAIDAVNNSAAAAERNSATSSDTIAKLNHLIKHGTPEQQARARKTMKGLAASGGFASGGFTGRGGKNEFAGIVHKGEYVIPQSQVDQSTGMPKGGNVQVTVNMSGVMTRSRSDLREITKDMLRAVNEELKSKGVNVIGEGAI